MRMNPETQKKLDKISAQLRKNTAKYDNIIKAVSNRRLEAFTEAGGCQDCRGRGWVVTWDTMDYLDGSAADYGNCPEKGCTQETRLASGIHPLNTKYDFIRGPVWHADHNTTDLENSEISATESARVKLEKKWSQVIDEHEVRKGKLVEVTRKSRATNSAEPGVQGKVFWYGVNDWGTVKVGLMDTDGNKHWTTEPCVKVIAQTAGKKYDQKYEDQYPLLCKVVKKTNRAICVMTPGQIAPFALGEWIPWSQVLNLEEVKKQLETGKVATVMLPPWLAKKKGYLSS